MPYFIGAVIIALIVFVFFPGLRIAQEYQKMVVFVLGRCTGIKGPGLFWIIPYLSRTVTIDTRTHTVDIDAQDTVTRDSVSIRVNAVLYYRVTDPTKAVLAVADYRKAIFQAALTTMRNIIGQNNMDEVLKNRDEINASMRQIVDEITDPWGLKVELVEMKDVEIPESMQRAMAKEAEAMREKRARIIKAEGEYEAARKLAMAAADIAENPYALELRRMQMISEVGTENNTSTILMIPSEFVSAAKSFAESVGKKPQKNDDKSN